MKKTVVSLLITFFLVSCHQKSGNSTIDNKSDVTEDPVSYVEEPVNYAEELKEFYTTYVIMCENDLDMATKDSLMNKYFTQSLLSRIDAKKHELQEKDDFLGYDPVIDAQDCFEDMLKGLEVQPDSIQPDVYHIITHYNSSAGDDKKVITYLLVDENGSFKIDRILSDPNFN